MKYPIKPFLIVLVCAVIGATALWQFSSNAAENDTDPSVESAQASTQPPVDGTNQSADAWLKRCGNKPESEEKDPSKCEIFQRISMKETGQRLIEIAIGYDPATQEPRAAFIVPLGIIVNTGISYQVDENDPHTIQLRTCNQAGCIAMTPLSKSRVKELQEGGVLTIGFTTAENKPFQIKLSLRGFSKALKSIRPS